MPATADRVTNRSEKRQDRADDDGDNAERPDDGDLRQEADNKQDNAEDNQLILLLLWHRHVGAPPGTRSRPLKPAWSGPRPAGASKRRHACERPELERQQV